MNVQVIEGMVSFVLKSLAARQRSRLALTLFGGEPLMYPNICEAVLDAWPPSLPVTADLTTNGTSLPVQHLERMMERGLELIQVSLDGDRDTHNSTRITAGGRGSFHRIMDEVRTATAELSSMTWAFRINVTPASRPRLKQALRQLRDIVSANETLVYFEPIHTTETSNITGYSAELIDSVIDAYELAVSLGFGVPYPKHYRECGVCGIPGASGGCVVGPNGSLFSCVESVGHPNRVVGDVWKGYESPQILEERWTHCSYAANTDRNARVRFDRLVNGWLLDHHHEIAVQLSTQEP